MSKLIDKLLSKNHVTLSGVMDNANLCKLKSDKSVKVCKTLATLMLVSAMAFGTVACKDIVDDNKVIDTKADDLSNYTIAEIIGDDEQTYFPEQHAPNTMTAEQREGYNAICKIVERKLSSTETTYGDKVYEVVEEEELLQFSTDLSYAIEDYFKAYGASDWANPDQNQFWAENINYIVVGIAWRESEYRPEVGKDNHNGITGMDKKLLLKTLLTGNWLTKANWGDEIPYINCEGIDEHNPSKCIELTYYNLGYLTRNYFRKGHDFYDDVTGTRMDFWELSPYEYSDEMQARYLIASNRYGVQRIINSLLHRNDTEETERVIPIEEFIKSPYTNAVIDKTNILVEQYQNELSQ